MFFFTISLHLLLCASRALAYTPATPTNDTDGIGLYNPSGPPSIQLTYRSAEVFNDVSIMLSSPADSSGISRGAFVQFSEEGLTSNGTSTPWIAVISCDANATDSSPKTDIFTLAQERGASGAILYSRTSQACMFIPEFDFMDAVLDVYTLQNNTETQQMLSLFNRLNTSYINYNSTLLDQSRGAVEASLSNAGSSSNYIAATLRAPDSFFANGTNDNGTDTAPPKHSSGNPNTGLAMIILYAITGCVSALFIIVILSGAIRAIRHPERYGPRAPGVNGRGLPVGGQTRTGGLGRAILDTFPVIKFNQTPQPDTPIPSKDDLEHSAVELSARSPIADDSKDEKTTEHNDDIDRERDRKDPIPPSSSSSIQQADVKKDHPSDESGLQPSAIGHQTCPICIVDFEKGDDIRVLPCEGKHQFHQACVDPWLLELSSSCPLCREDFHALESMLSGETPQEEESNTEQTGRSHRFTRYLGFARRRRGSMPRAEQPGQGESSSSS